MTTDHDWPTDPNEHVWGAWMTQRFAPPHSTRYRTCVHPNCDAYESSETPNA